MRRDGILVMANGCFDLLHPGHIAHLKAAFEMGTCLIVTLTMDRYVGKGAGRPIMNWRQRAALLRATYMVSKVIPSKGPIGAILKYKPAIFVKGIDCAGGKNISAELRAACEKVGTEIRYTRTKKMSTTAIIKRIQRLA